MKMIWQWFRNKPRTDLWDLLDFSIPEHEYLERAEEWNDYFKHHPDMFENVYIPANSLFEDSEAQRFNRDMKIRAERKKGKPKIETVVKKRVTMQEVFVPRDPSVGEIWQYDYKGHKIRRLN